jgi:hypothetical protein
MVKLENAWIVCTAIGQVLAWSPVDAEGYWPTEPVRDLLEQLQSEDFETGLRISLGNKRGVTSRGLFEGGTQRARPEYEP